MKRSIKWMSSLRSKYPNDNGLGAATKLFYFGFEERRQLSLFFDEPLSRKQAMKKLKFENIGEMHDYYNLPEPENPLFSIVHTQKRVSQQERCDDGAEQISLANNFYSISLKNIVAGEIVYGRTKYDCSNGTMLFVAPNQNLIFQGIVLSSESYHIAFHEDYIAGHDIRNKIKKYGFFHYDVNEALHLSPKEERMTKAILENIKAEYHSNQDEFTKELILSQLDTLLRYADRFYKRQFLNRQDLNTPLSKKFDAVLMEFFESNMLASNGVPTVDWIANKLAITPRYLSDSLKVDTGKTAKEHIHLYLIDEAKHLLLEPRMTVAETAYKLGFEYPNYFSRLFKKKVGISPRQYIEKYSSRSASPSDPGA